VWFVRCRAACGNTAVTSSIALATLKGVDMTKLDKIRDHAFAFASTEQRWARRRDWHDLGGGRRQEAAWPSERNAVVHDRRASHCLTGDDAGLPQHAPNGRVVMAELSGDGPNGHFSA
jgi:hypothetical protein